MSPKHEIITAEYHGVSVSFTEDGWFNATAAAAKYGRRPNDWLALPATREYLAALDEDLNTGKSGNWVRVSRGAMGGTWLHPDLAVQFARWLDVRFAIWCDRQIRALLGGAHPHFDRRRMRHEAASSYRVMSQILQMTRQARGKTSGPVHFMTEAKLVNWAASGGDYSGLDRDALSLPALDLLAKLEEKNAVLIGCGLEYTDRKTALGIFAVEWKARYARTVALEAA